MTTREVPCLFQRAGTSRGAFLLDSDLPADPDLRERVVLSIYGSPDPRQIDGIGGGDTLTSKVAVVAPSARDDVDVEYTFGQVGVDVGRVFWVGNCGNMASGVGPFAVRRGLVEAQEPTTTVRILNTNTDKVLTATVEVRAGRVVEAGDVAIAGVPGTGAPILLDFGDCGGAVTGRLLPTGRAQEVAELPSGARVRLSIVDAATPFVFVPAGDVGMTGTELPEAVEGDPDLLERLEEVRAYAARALGLVAPDQVAREVSPSIPRVVAVSPPTGYALADGTWVAAEEQSVTARQMAMQRPHKTYAVTGTLCTAVAGAVPGTVVHELARPIEGGRFTIGHPGGVIAARVAVDLAGDEPRVREASLVRTARALLDGVACVPEAVWPR